jgi:hypothetical protein
MADQFVTAVVDYCVSGLIGELYATSGVSLQDGMRRETAAPTIALFTQTGGESFAQDQTEGYGFQVLVDSETASGARSAARDIYDLLHETVADSSNFGSYDVLWLRGVAPPQDIGPGPGGGNRFVVSTNFDARIKRADTTPDLTPGFDEQTNSLQNFSTKGQLDSITPSALGFVDNFSIAFWAKPAAIGPGVARPAFTAAESANVNVIEIGLIKPGSPPGTFVYIRITDAVGDAVQSAYYAGGDSAAWHHYVLTWDGSAGPGYPAMGAKVYIDGVETAVGTPLIVPLDSSTCTDAVRKISVGGRYQESSSERWPGLIYSVAIYSEVLDQAAITAIYNGGNGRDMDLQSNSGDYQASANLQDYYRVGVGTTDTDFGLDRGSDATDRSLETSTPGLTSSDLVADVPL